MNRRKFLITAGAAGATLAIAPSLLASDRGYHSYVFPLNAMEPEFPTVSKLADGFGRIHEDAVSVSNVWLHPDDAPAYRSLMMATHKDDPFLYFNSDDPELIGVLWGADVRTLPGLKERGTVWVHSNYHNGRVKLVAVRRDDRIGDGLVYPDASRATGAHNDPHVISAMRDSILMADQRVWASFWNKRNYTSVIWHGQDEINIAGGIEGINV